MARTLIIFLWASFAFGDYSLVQMIPTTCGAMVRTLIYGRQSPWVHISEEEKNNLGSWVPIVESDGHDGGKIVGYWPSNKFRNVEEPLVAPRPPDFPPYLDPALGMQRLGIVFDPSTQQGKVKFSATFNPTAWVSGDKVFMVVRGETEGNGKWKRQSLPYLASSTDGVHFNLVSDKPILAPTEPYEQPGGLEDFRFVDLSLKPFVGSDGKVFTKALYYTAFDGKTPRICCALFNESDMSDIRKTGPVFRDEDILRNPNLVGPVSKSDLARAWNKSPAVIQYDHNGVVHTVAYFNEGGKPDKDGVQQRGIWAAEISDPRHWNYPMEAASGPVITARPGYYDQNLVEPAFQPIVADLPAEIQQKTGEKKGIVVTIHGDSPPRGYQLGYRVFSLDNPTGKPIYESTGSFFWPKEPYEISGQVDKVVFFSGAVLFKGRWFFYYGGGDHVVAAASGVPPK